MTVRATNPLAQRVQISALDDVRTYARQVLPPALVPAHFVALDSLPRLPNGKTDRGKLPRPDADADRSGKKIYVAPTTPLEHLLCDQWMDLLGVQQVGVDTSFFDAGGTSLSLIRMAGRVKQATGQRVALRAFVAEPTVRALARALDPSGPNRLGAEHRDLRNATVAELDAAAVLPVDVWPSQTRPILQITSVLLTGGTGYTGAFLLREVIDRSSATIYVLTRADSDEHAAERVLDNLARYDLLRESDSTRLVGVSGDISRPYLGLTRKTYRALATGSDMIVHNAADSRWTISFTEALPTNVLGSLEVLRLAAGCNIPVHYVGSTGSFPSRAGRAKWLEGPIPTADGVSGGYRQSKWVSDSLMHEARKRGFRVSVYRPGALIGAQDTGACATETFINHLIKGWVQLGAAMRYDLDVEMVPIDFCAKAIAHIALGNHDAETYHLLGVHTVAMDEVLEHLIAYGFELEVLPYPQWRERLLDAVERGAENELTPYLPLFGEDAPGSEIGVAGSKATFDESNLQGAIAGSGISRTPLDRTLMTTYLDYFVRTGFLPAPRQESI